MYIYLAAVHCCGESKGVVESSRWSGLKSSFRSFLSGSNTTISHFELLSIVLYGGGSTSGVWLESCRRGHFSCVGDVWLSTYANCLAEDFCCILKIFGRHVDFVELLVPPPLGREESDTELDRPVLGADLLRRILFAAWILSNLCDSTASISFGWKDNKQPYKQYNTSILP